MVNSGKSMNFKFRNKNNWIPGQARNDKNEWNENAMYLSSGEGLYAMWKVGSEEVTNVEI